MTCCSYFTFIGPILITKMRKKITLIFSVTNNKLIVKIVLNFGKVPFKYVTVDRIIKKQSVYFT